MPEEGIFSAKSTTSGSIPRFGFTVTVPDNRKFCRSRHFQIYVEVRAIHAGPRGDPANSFPLSYNEVALDDDGVHYLHLPHLCFET
jgi:hypothetical protein